MNYGMRKLSTIEILPDRECLIGNYIGDILV